MHDKTNRYIPPKDWHLKLIDWYNRVDEELEKERLTLDLIMNYSGSMQEELINKTLRDLEKVFRKQVAQEIRETMVFPSNKFADYLDALGVPPDTGIYAAFADLFVDMKYSLADTIENKDV